MKETKFILQGLNCAHCASKIESLVKKLEYVEDANLNFVSKTLDINLKSTNEHNIFNDVKRIVKRLEPDVEVIVDENSSVFETENYSNTSECIDSCNCDCNHEHIHQHSNSCDCNHVHTHQNGNSCNCSHEHIQHKLHSYNNEQNTEESINTKNTDKANTLRNNKKLNKAKLIRIVLATAFFIPSIIFESNGTLSMILSSIAYIIIGYNIVIKAFKNLINGQVFDENFLMSVASIGAFVIGEYPEATGVMLFYTIGEYFQGLAVNKSRNQIQSLLNIKPDYANLKLNDKLIKISPNKIKVGDIIVVKSGEKVPLDGIIIEGSTSLDTSALTGESMPVDKTEGDEILSGSINQTGVISVKVTKIFKESTVSKILYMVEKAANRKSHTENFISKFARYYTPIVVAVAAIIAVIPPVIFKAPLNEWLYKGLTFLVVSCPCALVLSIPLTYFSGIGRASRSGILIKGSNYLEALSKAEIAVFDKTGTLTEGKFNVIEVNNNSDNISNEELLEIAAYGEYYSNHPIAISVKEKYNKNIDENRISEYTEIAGFGIQTKLDGKPLLVGNIKLMKRNNIKFNIATDKPGTTLYIAYNGTYAGNIVISDKIKADTFGLINSLKSLGIKETVMLTGDNSITAKYVQKQTGIDNVYSELLPTDKVTKVEEIFMKKSEKGKLIFVGDGINDAPVLTRADIGIAMGGIGSDAAIESADVVIMNDEPSKLIESIKIANKTKSIVWQNIIFSLGVKLIVMLLTIYTNVTMPLAVFADVGVAIIAVLNASRILKLKTKQL